MGAIAISEVMKHLWGASSSDWMVACKALGGGA